MNNSYRDRYQEYSIIQLQSVMERVGADLDDDTKKFLDDIFKRKIDDVLKNIQDIIGRLIKYMRAVEGEMVDSDLMETELMKIADFYKEILPIRNFIKQFHPSGKSMVIIIENLLFEQAWDQL